MSIERILVTSLYGREPNIPQEYDIEIDKMIPEIVMLSHIVLERYQLAAKERSYIESQIAGILVTSLNSFVTSLILIREGHSNEPLVLLRRVLELSSVTIDLRINPKKSKDVKSGKHSSTKSISMVKNLLPNNSPYVGTTYGLLSDTAVHVNTLDWFPPHFESFGEESLYGVVKSNNEMWRIARSLHIACHILDLLSAFIEYIYPNYLQELFFWERLTNGELQFKLNPMRQELYESRVWLRNVYEKGFKERFDLKDTTNP